MLDCILKIKDKKRAFIKLKGNEIIVTVSYERATIFHSPGEAMAKAVELEEIFGEPIAKLVRI